jgi:hypothetical protein
MSRNPVAYYCPGIPTLSDRYAQLAVKPPSDAIEAAISKRVWEIAGMIRERNNSLGIAGYKPQSVKKMLVQLAQAC